MTIELTFENLNTSVQIGDTVWYANDIENNSGVLQNVAEVGVVTDVTGNDIKVDSIHAGSEEIEGKFLMFSKNKKANLGNLKGYYAETKFVNKSTKKVELFSVGSEITQSSK